MDPLQNGNNGGEESQCPEEEEEEVDPRIQVTFKNKIDQHVVTRWSDIEMNT